MCAIGRGGLAIVGTVVEIIIEQTGSGGVTRLDLVVFPDAAPLARIKQVLLYVNRQLFAQFDTPLIKRINVPNEPLNSGAVFVQSQELATRVGCQFGQQQRQTGSVSFEDFVRY